MIMAPRQGDCPEIAAARAAWAERGDAAAALALLPLGAAAERAVMGHFARAATKACDCKAERNLAGALASIPRTLRMMFIHAYQSYLWNHAASHRARTYDMEHAVEGDLVADNAPSAGASDAADAEEDDAEAQRGGLAGVRVRQVTAAEAAAKSVPIDDVLLPLPAASSMYPGNSVREVYARLADGDGVSLSGGQHSVREFSLSGFTGGYRHLMHRPTRLAFRLLRYEDPGRDLTRSDLTAILEAEGRRTVDPLAQPPPEPSVSDDSAHELGQGRYLALQLSFQLPASGYATMLIRELLKTSTTVAFHKGLNAHADE
jgi:tRNA pseudouridine13 synthase